MSIKKIDTIISKQMSLLKNEIEKFDFQTNYEFEFKDAKFIFNENELKFKGIYLIEIQKDKKYTDFKEWIINFKKEWISGKFYHSPRLRKKSIDNLHINDKWIPIYIGKSKNVGKRVNEHLFLENDKPTYALKLESKEFLKQEKFRIRTMKINVTNYDQIVPFIESELRNKINPIIGKQ